MKRKDRCLLPQLLKCIAVFAIIILPSHVYAQKEFYTPKSLIIPLHDQKNQLHIAVGRGGGYDLNLSYSFTSKLVLFSAVTFDNGTKNRISLLSDKYNVERNDLVLKGGLGYFFKADNSVFSLMETYVGVGTSKIDNYWYFKDENDGEVTKASYLTAFGQFNAGNKVGRNEYAVGVRLAYSNYTDFDFYGTHSNSSNIKSRYENLKGLTVDPAATYSYNLKGVKLNVQVGIALPLFPPSVRRTDTHTTYEGAAEIKTLIRSEEEVALSSVLGRLSIQYDLNFNRQK